VRARRRRLHEQCPNLISTVRWGRDRSGIGQTGAAENTSARLKVLNRRFVGGGQSKAQGEDAVVFSLGAFDLRSAFSDRASYR
jgi:hypothetical protein